MAITDKKFIPIDVHRANNDSNGTREIIENHEIVKYRIDSNIRVWYNDLNTNYDPHWHNALEIICSIDNYYDAVIADTTYRIREGDILIIPSGEIHQLIAPETGTRFIFMIDLSVISKICGFSNIQALMSQPLHITNTSPPYISDDLHRILMQVSTEYFGMGAYKELTIFSLLINFFVHIGNNHINSSQFFPNVRVYKQKEYIQKFNDVMDYIDAHYMDELTLEDVASTIGFSKYHFTRLFKQYTNTTFYDYLSFKRIKVAENLLMQPDLSITEVALQSGFSSISTFNRCFKQQKNCTPSEYRNLYSHKGDPFL